MDGFEIVHHDPSSLIGIPAEVVFRMRKTVAFLRANPQADRLIDSLCVLEQRTVDPFHELDQHRLAPSHEEHLKLSACWAENDPDRSLGRPSRGSGSGRDCKSRPVLPVAAGLSLASVNDYSNRTENREEHQDS